jgi:biotin transport system substrate-specific component
MSASTRSALVPALLGTRAGAPPWEAAVAVTGVLLLSLLAQIAIPLPWTPVPITGQTFGVTLIALSFGRRAVPVVLAYLAVGAAGLPVFAGAKAGLVWGPTVGYLVGMVFSSAAIGILVDRGLVRSFPAALGAGFLGSVAVFGCGLAVLGHFVPEGGLLAAGLWPFLPGDLVKTTLAAAIATRLNKAGPAKAP